MGSSKTGLEYFVLYSKMQLMVNFQEDRRWLRIGHGIIIHKEISEFKDRITEARQIFMVRFKSAFTHSLTVGTRTCLF